MFLPYKRFTAETALTIDQAAQTLSQVTQSSRPFWPKPLSDERRHFIGNVTTKGFRIVRNIYYLNSFLPEIKGSFEPSGGVTIVRITMIGNPLIMTSFLAVFAFFAFFLLVYLPTAAMPNFWLVLGTLAGGGLGYLTYTCLLAINLAIDRDYLSNLFSKRAVGDVHKIIN